MDEVLERIVKCIGPRHGAKKELAEYLNIHPNVITNWLNGRNKSYRKYLPQIAYYYNTSVDYLQFGNERKEESTADSSELDKELKGIDFALYGEVKELTIKQDFMKDGEKILGGGGEMEITIKAEPKEIAALVAAIQERQSVKLDSKSVTQAICGKDQKLDNILP